MMAYLFMVMIEIAAVAVGLVAFSVFAVCASLLIGELTIRS